MAHNDAPDPGMERRLREHFSEEARDLRAPDDLWARIEGRLGEQQQPRFAFLRDAATAFGGRTWVPAAAAALLVVAAGVGVWALAGGPGDGDGAAPMVAAPAVTAAPTGAPTAPAATATPVPTAAVVRPIAAATAAPTAAAATRSLAATAAPTAAATAAAAAMPIAVATAAPAATAAAAPTATAAAAATATPAPAATAEPTPAADDAAADDGSTADAAPAVMEEAAEPAAPPQADSGGGSSGPKVEQPSQPQQPSATTFQDYGRTPFVDTSSDAVSTFSLDTDRTSYFLALNWVNNGYSVEPDSVRAEEWINSFDYGYDAPSDDRSFAVSSDVVEHPLDEGRHLARIAFQAPELRDDTPLNVTLVLDASGSMQQGNRVAIAREAAETIRQSLNPRDRIAVVHFTSSVIEAYTVEHSAPDDEDVAWSISRLQPHASTNVQAGLNLGVKLADAARAERPEAFNYVILMSDGVANVDATNPFAILESAADSDSRNPLRLITIGVGIENYNDYLLEQLAQHGNGWYRYLDDIVQAQETFSRESWLALSTPFADQTRAQLTWDPAVVQAWRIVGYENRITPDHTFEQDRKEFAELPSGASTTVFYELVLHEDARDRSSTLGSVELRWVDPASGASLSQSAGVSGHTGASFAGGDGYLRLGAIVGLAADRYSSLSPQVEGAEVDYAGIHGDLAALGAELDALQAQLGSLEAYTDFRFLLDQLTTAAEELAPSSGYSQ